MTVSATPFTIAIPDAILEKIKARIRAYEWPEDMGTSWTYGVNLGYLRELCTYLLERYDWRAQERALNRFPQFRRVVDIAGQPLALHYYYEKGSQSRARPLMLIHGWPGSVVEFLHLIEPLAHPERFGGRADEGFDVIVPSLPGYGFSDKPKRPVGPAATARGLHQLVRDEFGIERILLQGGDWGANVTSQIALQFPEICAGLHINAVGLAPNAKPDTEEEKDYVARSQPIMHRELGYFHVQRSKPETIGLALADSPVGTIGWILEKFHGWSDIDRDAPGGKGLEAVYTKDQLLANIMIYLVTGTIRTSVWYYRGFSDEADARLKRGQRVEVPTAFAAFNDGIALPPPRSWVEKAYAVTRYTKLPRGGHFAAFEQGELFANDVRAFARELSY